MANSVAYRAIRQNDGSWSVVQGRKTLQTGFDTIDDAREHIRIRKEQIDNLVQNLKNRITGYD
jgi:hypothetical protein